MLLDNGKPSKNAKTRIPRDTINARKFTILARRPELSLIEDIFRILKKEFNQAVLKQSIMYNNFDSFSPGMKVSLILWTAG